MKNWNEINEALKQDLDTKVIKYRPGDRGIQIPYLDSAYVKRKANEVFGVDGWLTQGQPVQVILPPEQREHVRRDGSTYTLWHAAAYANLHLTVRGFDENGSVVEVHHRGDGTCAISANSPEQALETAHKGAASDALKRSFVSLGPIFGSRLYEEDYRRSLNAGNGRAQSPKSQPIAAQGNRGAKGFSRGPVVEKEVATEAFKNAKCPQCGNGCNKTRDDGTPFETAKGAPYVKCKSWRCGMCYCGNGWNWRMASTERRLNEEGDGAPKPPETDPAAVQGDVPF